jgi:hypothetical protein
MKLRIALDEKMMDVRVRDRLLAEGKITKKEVDEFLANLPDDSARAEKVVDNTHRAEVTE